MMSYFDIKDRIIASSILRVVLLPLYFFGFTVIFRPERMLALAGEVEFTGWVAAASMDILVSVILVEFLHRHIERRLSYALWCVVRMIAMSVAFALYLGFDLGFFAQSVAYIFLIYPMPMWIMCLRSRFTETGVRNEELTSSDKMRFCDEKGRLKLIASSESVVYIQADDNNIKINYLDNGICSVLVLRNTMKAIDEMCQFHGLMRTHRSYFVNPNHATWVGRDENDCVYVTLDIPDMPHIPVTKRYYDRVVEKVSQKRP